MSVKPVLAVSCLVLSGSLATQEPAMPVAPAAPVDAYSRVERILKTLRAAPSWRCETTTSSKSNPLLRLAGGAGKQQVSNLCVIKEGDVLCWSKDDGAQVLAARAGQWVTLDRDGDWIPARRPVGHAWRSQHLHDVDFLAERLLQLGNKVAWTAAGSETVGDKECRVYAAKVELDEATHLARTGALDASSSLASGIGGMVVMAAGPGAAPMLPPEPEMTFEIAIYEDPATKLPARITVKTFSDDEAGLGNVRVMFQGAGGQQIEEEEEEETQDAAGNKVKKPSATTTYELKDVGAAKATELKKAARKLLGLEE